MTRVSVALYFCLGIILSEKVFLTTDYTDSKEISAICVIRGSFVE
jgi:hypothetical protein